MNAPARNARPGVRTGRAVLALLLSVAAPTAQSCGEVVSVETRTGSHVRYTLTKPTASAQRPVTLVLLPGGSGFVDLDDRGCPRLLKGNSLIRSIPLFDAAGFATALVDAPSGYHGEDGLEGFRIDEAHAQDIGRVIADLRSRIGGPVWVAGTSRGSISAVNAASRLHGASAPDGIVLTSALMSGDMRARKRWVAHSVFDLPLDRIRVPVLVVGHAADTCIRSPASRMDEIVARTVSEREQVVTISGGGGRAPHPGIDACEGQTPHGFVGQEGEVAAGIARFIREGRY